MTEQSNVVPIQNTDEDVAWVAIGFDPASGELLFVPADTPMHRVGITEFVAQDEVQEADVVEETPES